MTDAAQVRAAGIADVMLEAGQTVNIPGTLEERLRAIAQAAIGAVPGFDHASISVAFDDKSAETRGASSPQAEEFDRCQYDAGEGPCLTALAAPGSVISVPRLGHEQRWGSYVPGAVAAGVKSQLAVHIGCDGAGSVRGALNLYSTTDEEIDPEAAAIAAMLAGYAAMALGWANTKEQLDTALTTRTQIGTALGILMERHQITEDKAFAFLVRVSSTGNMKLREVAREVVVQTEDRYRVKDS